MAVGLLPAAGLGRRMGLSTPKELVVHRGRPVVEWSVDHLVDVGVDKLVLVIRPGKEAVADHIASSWPQLDLVVVHQQGPIGNLVDALRAASSSGALDGHDVYLLFPDTYVQPNPFTFTSNRELTLLCHDAGDRWRHFGVVDPLEGLVVEKPSSFTGSICWGAASWRPSFTARLEPAVTLTDAINRADWEHRVTIACYEDIGLGPRADASSSGPVPRPARRRPLLRVQRALRGHGEDRPVPPGSIVDGSTR